MARRMTDTAKWDDDWFMNLSPVAKLLWLYLVDQCDHAGVWRVNRRLAAFQMGMEPNWDEVLNELGDRIAVLPGGEKWHLKKFVEYQYGPTPNDKNNAHLGVLKILKSLGLPWSYLGATHTHTSPCLGALDMGKDKEMDSKRESPEREKSEQRKIFKDLLIGLMVSEGPKATRYWWNLAKENKLAKTFEDRCDLVKWCVARGRERGAVNHASDVVGWAKEWRP